MTRFSRASACWVHFTITMVLLLALPLNALAQPEPGYVFREYRWTNEGGDAGGSLRVGGRFGYDGGPIELRHKIDLDHAIGAEVVVEKLLCHDGTRGLAISWNDHAWIKIPEAEGIPAPQWEYQHRRAREVGDPQRGMRTEIPHPRRPGESHRGTVGLV